MRADEVMSSPVVTVRTDDPVRAAAEVLSRHRIASAPVLDGAGRVVGMFSELDAIRGRLPHDPRNHLIPPAPPAAAADAQVHHVMTPAVVCCSRRADVAHLAQTMIDNRVQAVPILDGAELVGIVARRDLIRLVVQGHDDEIPATHWRPAGSGPVEQGPGL